MIIKNGLVFHDDKTFQSTDICIQDGRIVSMSPTEMRAYADYPENEIIDATGLFVLPGLIDIHSHGAVGHDFSDGNLTGLKEILAYEYAHGITTYCPTSMTLEKERLLDIFAGVNGFTDEPGLSHFAGINMEGPFLDTAKKGAHLAEYIAKPDAEFFRKCNLASV